MPPRTTAHDHKQLAKVLGWTTDQVDKAVQLGGILPPYDLTTPRWKGATVDALAARRDELTAALDDHALLTAGEMIATLGLSHGDWHRGVEHGLISHPDQGRFWSRAVADDLAARAALLPEQIPPQPLGAVRCTDLLAELTGAAVTTTDFMTLVELGRVDSVDEFKGFPLYDVGAVRQLGSTPEGQALVAATVAERIEWLQASITTGDAAGWLEWDQPDFVRTAQAHGMTTGRFGRWERADIARLEADEQLTARIRRQRLLGPERAAAHMQIRRRDFDYVVAAGWACPDHYETRDILDGFKDVQVPLYTVGSLDDALLTPGVDWEEVRSVKPGEPSPLREYTRLPRARAELVRAFCTELGARYGVEVWPHFANRADTWEIDWEQLPDGHPTKAEVASALASHRGASKHAEQIVLSTAVGDVIRQARACLEPGAAVICDFETTDLGGVGVELAVIDACHGNTLLDTLISPDGVPVTSGARAVHGITDAELAHAPTWRDVAPQFLAAVDGKQILAYNASFDRSTAAITHQHAGLRASQLPPPEQWFCLMEALSTWHRVGRWFPLGGSHRALGDANEARQVLLMLAAPIESYRAAKRQRQR